MREERQLSEEALIFRKEKTGNFDKLLALAEELKAAYIFGPARAVLRARAKITSHFYPPIHPVCLRCSSLK